MKALILLSSLVFLASCTHNHHASMSHPVSPAMEDTMIKNDSPMLGTEVMDDKKMMSGSWTHEEMKSMSGESMMNDAMDKKMNDTMTGADTMKQEESDIVKPTGYMNYTEAKVNEALASGQKVVLFFHATWCPSCKSLDTAINADLSSIPTDALIVKVDYDSSEELKKKYRVVGQHILVTLNTDGTEKSKKLGARSVAEVLN